MPSPPNRKPSRSIQQILAENEATVKFYQNMTMTAGGLYNILSFFFFFKQMSSLAMTLNVMVSFIYVACYHAMRFISQPNFSMETLQLVNPGCDLNMAGGMGEFLKDIMIIASVTHLMALFSNKFWLTLLVIPLRGFWLVWMGVLGPWYAHDEVEEVEVDEEDGNRKNAEKIKLNP